MMPITILRAGATITAGAIALPWAYLHGSWLTPPGRDIRSVVSGAVRQWTALQVPPPAARHGLSAPAAKRVETRIDTTLRLYYAGADLRDWEHVFHGIVTRMRRPNPYPYEWQVIAIAYGSLRLYPGGADATLRVTTRNNGFRGVIDKLDYHFHLRPTSRGWRITGEHSAFVPGYGP